MKKGLQLARSGAAAAFPGDARIASYRFVAGLACDFACPLFSTTDRSLGRNCDQVILLPTRPYMDKGCRHTMEAPLNKICNNWVGYRLRTAEDTDTPGTWPTPRSAAAMRSWDEIGC
jgi:hypothetical protein